MKIREKSDSLGLDNRYCYKLYIDTAYGQNPERTEYWSVAPLCEPQGSFTLDEVNYKDFNGNIIDQNFYMYNCGTRYDITDYYNNGKYTELLTTKDTSATFYNLKNGSRYKFLVKYTIDGKLSPINYAGRAIVNIYYKPIVTASAETNSITLRWKAVPNAEKYAVYKYVDGKAVKLAEVKGTSAKITKLSSDTEYSYIVSAYVDGKWTKMYKSDIVTVKTLAE